MTSSNEITTRDQEYPKQSQPSFVLRTDELDHFGFGSEGVIVRHDVVRGSQNSLRMLRHIP
jgi:hypothetical protein